MLWYIPSNYYQSSLHCYSIIAMFFSQSPVTIADGVDSSPTEYIFSYGTGSPITVSTGSTPQCNSSSCQHTYNTFREISSPVQLYNVSVAAKNVVGVGNASRSWTVGK